MTGGVFGLTFVALLVLKLTGVISIGWGLVFLPLALAIIVPVVIALALSIIVEFTDRR